MTDNDNSKRAHPLHWPEGYPRTTNPKRAKFDDWTINQVRKELEREVKLFGGTDLIISSNLELNQDGTPRSKQRQPTDVGVAIYFDRDGVSYAMPEDLYNTVQDNLRALVLTLDSLRGIERHGGVHLVERAFKGFRALNNPDALKWHEALVVPSTSNWNEVKHAYRILAAKYHPDNPDTGDAEQFIVVNAAYDEAKKVFGES